MMATCWLPAPMVERQLLRHRTPLSRRRRCISEMVNSYSGYIVPASTMGLKGSPPGVMTTAKMTTPKST